MVVQEQLVLLVAEIMVVVVIETSKQANASAVVRSFCLGVGFIELLFSFTGGFAGRSVPDWPSKQPAWFTSESIDPALFLEPLLERLGDVGHGADADERYRLFGRHDGLDDGRSMHLHRDLNLLHDLSVVLAHHDLGPLGEVRDVDRRGHYWALRSIVWLRLRLTICLARGTRQWSPPRMRVGVPDGT